MFLYRYVNHTSTWSFVFESEKSCSAPYGMIDRIFTRLHQTSILAFLPPALDNTTQCLESGLQVAEMKKS